MVRDAANPSTDDPYFPVSRSFDWYHGHSWAKGLFESGDGKDEESSSEDAFFAYAVKMWGKTIGDANMEARGNLMLSVLTRTLHTYFLMESTNFAQPKPFIDNKVTGIVRPPSQSPLPSILGIEATETMTNHPSSSLRIKPITRLISAVTSSTSKGQSSPSLPILVPPQRMLRSLASS